MGVREGRMEHISIYHLGLKLPAPTWKPSAGLLQEGLLYCNADPPLTCTQAALLPDSHSRCLHDSSTTTE